MIYRKVFDTTTELAEWYDAKYTEMSDGWNTPPEDCWKHLNVILSIIPLERRDLLVDVGCGAGHFLKEACTVFDICVGLEISKIGCELSRKRAREACIIDAGVECMKCLGDDTIDCVASIGSIEHVINLEKALDEINRVLRSDGLWYFYLPNEKWMHFDQPNERTATAEEWKRLFESHGLVSDGESPWNGCTAIWGHKRETSNNSTLLW